MRRSSGEKVSSSGVYDVVDCIGSLSSRTEAAAFREIELAGAMSTSVLSMTKRCAPDFFHPPGSGTFAAIEPILQLASIERRTANIDQWNAR